MSGPSSPPSSRSGPPRGRPPDVTASAAAIPDRPYADWGNRIGAAAVARRIPLAGMFETTHRCNLSCVHCYVNLPANDRAARAREMTTAEVKRVLDEAEAAGTLFVCFTGGEPLLRPDWREIYLHAQRRGLLVILFTNGTLVTTAVADFLAAHAPYSVEITVYGATRATYERVTRVPGSYDRCLRGIHLLVERRVPVLLKGIALTISAHEILALRRLAASLGLKFKWDAELNPRIDGSPEPLRYRLDPEEILRLEEADGERRAKLTEVVPREAEITRRLDTGDLYTCGAGLNGYLVDPYGTLRMCTLSRRASFDLRRGRFLDGWNGPLRDERARRRSAPRAACGGPAAGSMVAVGVTCAACPGRAALEADNPEGDPEFSRRLAVLRYERFGGAAAVAGR